MKRIYIKSKRLGLSEIMVDDQDFDLVSKYTWYVSPLNKYKHVSYAQTCLRKPNGKFTSISMHRLILGHPNGVVDHIDRNGLNNQRSNLRVVDTKVNRLNSKLNSNNTTGHRNIIFNPKNSKFEVKLIRKINGVRKSFYYGAYNTIEEALIVRDKNVAFHDEPPKQYCFPCLGMINFQL
jgi:hypothetical protein